MTESAQKNQTSDAQVAAYLRDNTDFFDRNSQLLEELSVSRPSGDAVSLVERQLEQLRNRNAEMHKRLSALIETAKENDRLLTHTQNLILRQLEATNLDELIQITCDTLVNEFETDVAQITLYQPLQAVSAQNVSLAEAEKALGGLAQGDKAICGNMRPEEFAFLFSQHDMTLKSAAICPLRYGQSYGVLAIGARDAERYHSSVDTLFLAYVGDLTSRLIARFT